MIGDSLGSLLVYDSLCQANSSNLERSSNANSVSSSAVNLNNNNFIFGDQLSAAHNLLGSTSSQVEFSISEASELDTIVNDASRGSTKNNTLNDDSQDNQTNNKSYLGSNNNSSFKSMKSRLSTSPNLSTHLELSVAGEEKLDFDVTNFFALGSPLATVLLSRQIANKTGMYKPVKCSTRLIDHILIIHVFYCYVSCVKLTFHVALRSTICFICRIRVRRVLSLSCARSSLLLSRV